MASSRSIKGQNFLSGRELLRQNASLWRNTLDNSLLTTSAGHQSPSPSTEWAGRRAGGYEVWAWLVLCACGMRGQCAMRACRSRAVCRDGKSSQTRPTKRGHPASGPKSDKTKTADCRPRTTGHCPCRPVIGSLLFVFRSAIPPWLALVRIQPQPCRLLYVARRNRVGLQLELLLLAQAKTNMKSTTDLLRRPS